MQGSAVLRSFHSLLALAGPAALRSGLLVAVAGLSLGGDALAQKLFFKASIDGAQETPPNASPAKGTGSFVVDLDANTLSFDISFAMLSAAESGAHIHVGAAGIAGPIVFALPAGTPKMGVWNYPQANEADIVAGNMYVNIHSGNFPGGEIRGQILRSNAPTSLAAKIDPIQEVPPPPSNGSGSAAFAVDTLANALSFDITFTNLTSGEVSAHIHQGAPGVNGPIKFNLPLGFNKKGTWFYPQADEGAILTGQMYVNIHSANFPGGEIRGQMLPVATNPSTYCTAKVNSLGCTPMAGASGETSLTGPDNLVLGAKQVVNNKFGIFFWGKAPNNLPFMGGTLCIQSPTVRTPPQMSGGNAPPANDCSGAYSFAFTHAYAASQGLGAGSLIYGQFWSRDPAHPDGTGVGFTDAVQFELRP